MRLSVNRKKEAAGIRVSYLHHGNDNISVKRQISFSTAVESHKNKSNKKDMLLGPQSSRLWSALLVAFKYHELLNDRQEMLLVIFVGYEWRWRAAVAEGQ